MKKTENLANVANAILRMTYRELTDLAESIEGDADKLITFAEEYMAPEIARAESMKNVA